MKTHVPDIAVSFQVSQCVVDGVDAVDLVRAAELTQKAFFVVLFQPISSNWDCRGT